MIEKVRSPGGLLRRMLSAPTGQAERNGALQNPLAIDKGLARGFC